jgi:hypothetical protein
MFARPSETISPMAILPTNTAEFLKFWWQCFLFGWNWGGSIEWASDIIFGLVLVFYLSKKFKNQALERKEVVLVRAAAWVFIGSFLIAAFFVAPFLQYNEAKHNPDTKVQHDIPYETVESNYNREKSRADQAYKNWQETSSLLTEAYSQTNLTVTSESIREAKEKLNGMWEKTIPQSGQDAETAKLRLKLMVQRAQEQGALDKLANEAAAKEAIHKNLDPVYPIFITTLSRFRSLLAESSKKCKGGLSADAPPSEEDIIGVKNSQGGDEHNMGITLGTNCSWKCTYRFGVTTNFAWMYMSCDGASKITLGIRSEGGTLTVTEDDVAETLINKSCPVSSYTNCVNILDEALHTVIQIQDDEF